MNQHNVEPAAMEPPAGKIRFTDVNIGQPFKAHNTIWVRTGYDSAIELDASQRRGSFGSCNFMQEAVDEFVEPFDFAAFMAAAKQLGLSI